MIFHLPAHHIFTILNSFFLSFILLTKIEHHLSQAIDNCVSGIQIPSGEVVSRAFISSNIPIETIFKSQNKTDSEIVYIYRD